ncbi:MAG: pyridoxal-phosphate dependent enzyme [Rhodobacteraceae bacterium]|nr:pyridoxal-phosphate dependent enzyme [Paracoccaceae bacterium]
MLPGLVHEIVDHAALDRNRRLLREAGVVLPRIGELADPAKRLAQKSADIANADPDGPDARNLYRLHWHNGTDRRSLADVPAHIVLPEALTGVSARIVVALGDRFPMIRAHKVLAAYGCLLPHLLSGALDVTRHRVVWPSTGNYCRGGVAIGRLLGCRSAAVLPEGMSQERFDWLESWIADPDEIIRTPGTESNVKEIYDACHLLAEEPGNLILNQFAECGNYVTHRSVTGPALQRVFEHLDVNGGLRPRAVVAAAGSAGTLAAADHLKAALDTDTGVVEAVECPTLLYAGYGEHNIQGIGDKHVSLIHNVMASDFIIGVSDRASDGLNLLFNTAVGRRYLSDRKGVGQELIAGLGSLGLSSIANVIGAIKYARYMQLDENDAVLTVATDGADMYRTEMNRTGRDRFGGEFSEVTAAETYGRYILGAAIDHVQELNRFDRERIFNLGYFTWVEQQGISLADFDRRRSQAFWNGLSDLVPVWDDMIDRFNGC